MPIETTRRGFTLLLGALAAAGAVQAEPHAPTKLQAMPGRFGYRVYSKGGLPFFSWIEGDPTLDFEFEVNMNTDVFATSFNDKPIRSMMMERPERYFHHCGQTYVVGPAKVLHDEAKNIVWLEFHDAERFDPATDRVHYAVGRLEPIVLRGVY